MAKKSDLLGNGDINMDLTPMIDVVFQLLIFFMIVTDMSSTDYVQLVMPQAKTAQKPDPDAKQKYIVVNIENKRDSATNKPYWQIRGAKLTTYPRLEKVIKVEAKAAGKEANPESPGSTVSALKVVIRCDKAVEYGVVQEVFKACSLNGVWKIVIAANEPDK